MAKATSIIPYADRRDQLLVQSRELTLRDAPFLQQIAEVEPDYPPLPPRQPRQLDWTDGASARGEAIYRGFGWWSRLMLAILFFTALARFANVDPIATTEHLLRSCGL